MREARVIQSLALHLNYWCWYLFPRHFFSVVRRLLTAFWQGAGCGKPHTWIRGRCHVFVLAEGEVSGIKLYQVHIRACISQPCRTDVLFPIHKAQRWHAHAKAKNARDWSSWFCLYYLASKQLPASEIQHYPLWMQIKKIIIAPKNFHSMCSMREVGAYQVVWDKERSWPEKKSCATCTFVIPQLYEDFATPFTLPAVAWIQHFGWVLYTACLWVSDSQAPWSLQLSQQEHSCLYLYLLFSFSLGSSFKMKLALRSRG